MLLDQFFCGVGWSVGGREVGVSVVAAAPAAPARLLFSGADPPAPFLLLAGEGVERAGEGAAALLRPATREQGLDNRVNSSREVKVNKRVSAL